MADPKNTLNPVTIQFTDTGTTTSQSVPVTAANPLPVTISGGGPDADVNLASVNGATSTAFGSGAIGTGTQRVTLATDSPGIVTLGQAVMASSVPVAIASNQSAIPASMSAAATGGYSMSNITTATTTTVKSGAGTLHGINVNTLGTIASTAVVYDNTAASGTKIATIDTLTAGNVGWNQYDVAFATGLTIVTTGTSAPDITVSYK